MWDPYPLPLYDSGKHTKRDRRRHGKSKHSSCYGSARCRYHPQRTSRAHCESRPPSQFLQNGSNSVLLQFHRRLPSPQMRIQHYRFGADPGNEIVPNTHQSIPLAIASTSQTLIPGDVNCACIGRGRPDFKRIPKRQNERTNKSERSSEGLQQSIGLK